MLPKLGRIVSRRTVCLVNPTSHRQCARPNQRFFHLTQSLHGEIPPPPLYKPWSEEDQDPEFEVRSKKVQELLEEGKANEALAVWDEALVKDPNNVNALAYQSLIACTVPGRWEEALSNIGKAINFTPRQMCSRFWVIRAFVLFVGKKYDDAGVTAKLGITMNTTSYLGHWALALSLSGLRQYNQAVTHYDEAIKYNPNDAELEYWRGEALFFLERNSEAFEWLNKPVLELKHPRKAYYHGLKSFYNKDYQAALNHFQSAVVGRCWNPSFNYDLNSWTGECHLALGNYSKALESFEEAIKKQPTDGLSHHGKGEALLHLKETEKAQEAFAIALRVEPLYQKSDYFRIKTPKL